MSSCLYEKVGFEVLCKGWVVRSYMTLNVKKGHLGESFRNKLLIFRNNSFKFSRKISETVEGKDGTCSNTVGSYQCLCRDGYQQDEDCFND